MNIPTIGELMQQRDYLDALLDRALAAWSEPDPGAPDAEYVLHEIDTIDYLLASRGVKSIMISRP